VTKKYRVEITASAEADVADIWEYIAQDNPRAAMDFVIRIELAQYVWLSRRGINEAL